MNRFDCPECDQGEYGYTTKCEGGGNSDYAANNSMQIAKCVQACRGIEDEDCWENERVDGVEKLGEKKGGDFMQERLGENRCELGCGDCGE